MSLNMAEVMFDLCAVAVENELSEEQKSWLRDQGCTVREFTRALIREQIKIAEREIIEGTGAMRPRGLLSEISGERNRQRRVFPVAESTALARALATETREGFQRLCRVKNDI